MDKIAELAEKMQEKLDQKILEEANQDYVKFEFHLFDAVHTAVDCELFTVDEIVGMLERLKISLLVDE